MKRCVVGLVLALFVLGASASLQSRVSAVDWSSLTASSLAQLDPNVFASITQQQLASIPAPACAGFSETQSAAILSDSCAGFTKQQMQTLSSGGYRGLTGACVSKLDASSHNAACAGISHQGMPVLSDSTVAALSVQCAAMIPSSVWANATASTVASFSGPVCFGMPMNVIVGLTPAAISGFTPSCISFFQSGSNGICLMLDDNFVNALNPIACSGFTVDCLQEAAVIAFAENHHGQACVANLNPASLDSFFISTIDATVFSYLQASQLANLTRQSCLVLTAAQVSEVANENINALAHCFPHMLPDVFRGITSTQITQLSGASMVYLTRPDKLDSATFSALTLSQVKKFGTDALGFLTGDLYVTLLSKWANPLLVDPNGWKPSMFSIFYRDDAVLTVKKAIEDKTLRAVVPVPTSCEEGFAAWPHIALMLGSPTNGWDATFMRCITPNAIAGFTPPQTVRITTDGMAEITPKLAMRIIDDTFQAFTKFQWAAFPAESLASIDGQRWTNVKCSECFTLLSAEQIEKIMWSSAPCSPVGGMTAEQFTAVDSPATISLYQQRRVACGFSELNIPGYKPPTDQGPAGNVDPVLIGSVVGGGVFLIIVIIIIVVVVRKRQAAAREREPLLVNAQ